jgi:hypothetical protein
MPDPDVVQLVEIAQHEGTEIRAKLFALNKVLEHAHLGTPPLEQPQRPNLSGLNPKELERFGGPFFSFGVGGYPYPYYPYSITPPTLTRRILTIGTALTPLRARDIRRLDATPTQPD